MSTRDYRTNNRITDDEYSQSWNSSYDDHDSTARRRDARVARGSEGGTTVRRGDTRSSSRTSYNARNVYVGQEPSLFERIMGMLPDNVWVNRAILAVIVLILLFILFNLVTCIGGAITGTSSQSSSAESPAAEGSAEASDASASAAAPVEQGVDSPWIENGKFSTGDSALDNYVKQLCDEHSSAGGTFDSNAYDTYIYVSRTDYVERKNNQSPWGPTWDIEYAKQYFEEGNSGNCYNFCAVTEYVLKYFGYSDAEAEPCVVKLESGSWGDHGLVFVTNKVDGKQCLVDDALSANGWMLDINSYDYDVRNINQNSSIKGNVNALDDDNNPTPIPNMFEDESSASSASADSDEDSDSENRESEDGENEDGEDSASDEESEEYSEEEGGEDYYSEEEGSEEDYSEE